MKDKQEQVVHIEAGKHEKQYFKDLWTYRELFFFLAWRDILVRLVHCGTYIILIKRHNKISY